MLNLDSLIDSRRLIIQILSNKEPKYKYYTTRNILHDIKVSSNVFGTGSLKKVHPNSMSNTDKGIFYIQLKMLHGF